MRYLPLLLLFATVAFAQDEAALTFDVPVGSGPVYDVPLSGTVDAALARYVDRALGEAEEDEAALVVLRIDTFGGLLDAADQIRKRVLGATVPTVAFVEGNALSAGALIAYAADRIVMAPGATMGAATVVQGGTGEAAPDKYQSAMRALMRATAEENGKDPAIAEAMVDERVDLPGVSSEGEVLTLSADEARELGVADAVLTSLDAVLVASGAAAQPRVAHDATGLERALRFFGSPVVQSILMLMMLGGLYAEMQAPGLGLPGALALIGALLFFAPSYAMGLAASWEIALFVVGVLLILLEVLVIPGFGVAGIAGAALTVGSLGAMLVGNVGLYFPEGGIRRATEVLGITLFLFGIVVIAALRYLPRAARFSAVVLHDESPSERVPIGSERAAEPAVGTLGQAATPLRPWGVALLLDRRVEVVTEGEFVEAGTPVRVVRAAGGRIVVAPVLADA
jgi:membrane-bound serine protease (ClpP class)